MIHLPDPPSLVDALGNPLREPEFLGTFSNVQSWSAPPSTAAQALDDLNRLAKYGALAPGYEFRAERQLEPRLEPDTFSGGLNVSARARNLDRINEACSRVYVFDRRYIIGTRAAIDSVRTGVANGTDLDHEIDRLRSVEWRLRHGALREWYRALIRKHMGRRAVEKGPGNERGEAIAVTPNGPTYEELVAAYLKRRGCAP